MTKILQMNIILLVLANLLKIISNFKRFYTEKLTASMCIIVFDDTTPNESSKLVFLSVN